MQSKHQVEICDAEGDEATLTTGSQVIAKIWKWKETRHSLQPFGSSLLCHTFVIPHVSYCFACIDPKFVGYVLQRGNRSSGTGLGRGEINK
jgi:hypothetical protein